MAIDPATPESAQPRPPRRRRPGGKASLLLIGALLVTAVAGLVLIDGGDGGTGKRDDSPKLAKNEALVYGRVVDDKTKKPLASARVLIKQGGKPTTVSADSRGRFQVVVTTTDPFAFETQAAGYMGTAAGAVAGLCARERFELNLALLPAGTREAPPAPRFLSGKCPLP